MTFTENLKDLLDAVDKKRAETQAFIRQMLADLGDTPDEIATALQGIGIKATPMSARQCALSQYLGDVVPDATWTRTTTREASVEVPGPDQHSLLVYIDLTEAQRLFVNRFDRLQYPDLVASYPDLVAP